MDNTEVIDLLKQAFELKRQCKYKVAMEFLYKALAICPDNTEILLQVAELHGLLENKNSAISLYEKLLAKNPSDVNIFAHLADFYVRSFEFDKAKVFMSKFLLSYPSNKAYEVYFKSLFAMGEFENIVEFYNEKNLARIGAPAIDAIYGTALCKTGKYNEAKSVLGTLASALKNDGEVSYYYAKALYETGSKELAEKILAPFLPNCVSAKILNLQGEIEMYKNNLERAIDYFTEAVKLSYDGLYFYNLASAYFLNGQLKEAKASYVKAIAASPEVNEYKYAQAYLYYKEQNFKKAKQILSSILDRQPDFKEAIILAAQILTEENKLFRAWKTLGMFPCEEREDEEYLKLEVKIYKGLYRFEAAVESMKKLIKLNSDSLDYKYDLACLYFNLGRFENAALLVTQIINKNNNYVNALILAAKIYLKTYDFKNVISMADKALVLDVNNTDAYYLKALSLVGLGRQDEAISVAKTLLSYKPGCAEAYALIGSCLAEKKEYEDALQYYNEAVVLEGENAEYFLNIAMLYSYLGNNKEHIRFLYLAHVLKPDNNEISTRLVDAYVVEKQYKQALGLLQRQYVCTGETALRKEFKSRLDEVKEMFKNSVNPFKYMVWRLFKI